MKHTLDFLLKQEKNKDSESEELIPLIKKYYFSILRIMIKEINSNMIVETFIVIMQLFQLLAYPFNLKLSHLWKSKGAEYISQIFSLCHLYPFYSNSPSHYLLMFFMVFLYLFIFTMLFIYLIYQVHKEKGIQKWLVKLLAYTSYFHITILFIPLLGFFNSPLHFTRDSSTGLISLSFADDIHIDIVLHGFLIVFGAIGIIIHLFSSYVFLQTFFEVLKIPQNPRSMVTSDNQYYLYIIKTVLVGFEFLLKAQGFQWFFITIILFLFAAYLYMIYDYCGYYDPLRIKYEILIGMIMTWASFVLFIAAMFSYSNYNGSFYLFLAGIAGIIVYCSMKDFNNYSNLFYSFEDISSPQLTLIYITTFLALIDEKSRKRDIIVKGYLNHIEDKCTIPKCPLKRYLLYQLKYHNCLEKYKREMKGFLYQHTEMLFEMALSKYPQSTKLRLYYVIFLYEKLFKKEQAANILSVCKNNLRNLTEEFLFYRFDIMIIEKIKDDNPTGGDDDLTINLSYNSHNNQFKNIIGLISSYYTDFWAVILRSNQEDFAKLNDYGSKINKLVEDLRFHFNQMLKLKVNNQSQIFYYSQFLRYVLNDEETADKLLKKHNLGQESAFMLAENTNFLKKDIYTQYLMDESPYILISAREGSFGLINNASIRVCSLLGYTKTELIGKAFQFLLPDFIAKQSISFLHNSYKKYLIKHYDPIASESSDELVFYSLVNYLINKSKYLVPIAVQYSFLANDEERSMILIKLKEDTERIHMGIGNDVCHILTNKALIIQNFTANSLNMVDLTTAELCNTVEITNLIVQFYEEYFHQVININPHDKEAKLQLKRDILETKFKSPRNISWSLSLSYSKSISEHDINSRFYGRKELEMTHEKIILNAEMIGYIFRFSPIKRSKSSNLDFGLEIRSALERKDLNIQIDKLFLPETKKHFILNSQKMTFLLKSTNDEAANYKEILKTSALEKIRQATTVTKQLTEESTSNQDDSYQNSSSYLSSNQESINDSQVLLKKTALVSTNSNNNDYYHVNVSKIKAMIYSFQAKTVIENLNYDKTSVVELKTSNKDFEDENLSSVENQGNKSNTEKSTKKMLGSQEESNASSLSNNKLLNKQIQHALKKEEVIDKILKMRYLTILLFLIMLGFNILDLMLIISSNTQILKHLNIIDKAETLIFNFFYGIIYSRELVLLNSKLYTPIFEDEPGGYVKNITEEVLIMYNESIDIINFLTQGMADLDDKIIEHMNAENITVQILKEARNEEYYYTFGYNLSSKGAFYEALNSLKNIAHLPINEIIPTQKYVFFFANNTCNDVYITVIDQIRLYKLAFNDIQTESKNNSIYSFVGGTFYVFIAYYVLFHLISIVTQQKNAFLQIFLEIEPTIISVLLYKCEYFIRLIQTNAINDLVSNEDTDIFEDKLLIGNNTIMINRAKNESKKRKEKLKFSKEQKVISIKMLIFFIVYEGFLSAMFYIMLMGSYEYEYKIDYYTMKNQIYWKHIAYFGLIREDLFFNEVVNVAKMTITDALYLIHQNIIKETYLSNEFNLNYSIILPTELLTMTEENPCTINDDFFNKYFPKRPCDTMMSNAFHYGGLSTGLEYFLNQMRSIKNMKFLYGNYNNETKYHYNNTLIGTKQYDVLRPSDPIEGALFDDNSSIKLLNTQLLKDMTVIVLYVFKPLFNNFKVQFIASIEDELSNLKTLYIIIIAVFSGLLIILFLFVWKPYEKGLNITITKTKNMLSIIPTDVLCHIKDIQKLLDINQSVVTDKNTNSALGNNPTSNFPFAMNS